MLPFSVMRQADDFPFTVQNLTDGNFSGRVFAPKVLTAVTGRFEVINVERLTSLTFQGGGPKLMFAQNGMPVEQMVFRPPDARFSDWKPIRERFWFGLPDQLGQRLPLMLGNLARPKPFKLTQPDAGDFSTAFSLGDLRAQFLEVAASQFGLLTQQLFNSLVNFVVPFREPGAEFLVSPGDLEIPSRMVLNLITESVKVSRQFVIIDIFHVFPRLQHFVVGKRLPAILDRVIRGV